MRPDPAVAAVPDVPAVAGPGTWISVNGQRRHVETGTTLSALLDEVVEERRGVAVAVDKEVVPRSDWTGFVVREGMDVEVVSAAAGG